LLRGAHQEPVRTYQLVANGIDVQVPKVTSASRLLVTFFYRARWHASIDNRAVAPMMNDLGMMEIPIGPGEHVVRLRYEGVTIWQQVAALLLAAAIVAAAARMARGKERKVQVDAAT
jgi:hypothetical protein